jgi:ElaB/YqjD/DUF883 family membrane-anchored ribosome-binding protein
MAHRSPIVPIRKQRTEPGAWPSSQQPQTVTAQQTAAADAKELYRNSRVAVERSFRDVRQKLSRTATSAVNTVRTFAHERPLHLIGIVAGASFVAGMALRIWRAKRYASREG